MDSRAVFVSRMAVATRLEHACLREINVVSLGGPEADMHLPSE